MKKNEKGFALVLSLVLLLVMSLMGGSLIVVTSGDHKNNNESDNYQQAFYVAESGLLAGERYIMNQYTGPWVEGVRNTAGRNLPGNTTEPTDTNCYNSFPDLDKDSDDDGNPDLKIVTQHDQNFGELLEGIRTLFPEEESTYLYKFNYEYFVYRVGTAPYSGYGSSIKKAVTDEMQEGMAYRIYSCGIYSGKNDLIVPLESVVVVAN